MTENETEPLWLISMLAHLYFYHSILFRISDLAFYDHFYRHSLMALIFFSDSI